MESRNRGNRAKHPSDFLTKGAYLRAKTPCAKYNVTRLYQIVTELGGLAF